MQEIVGAVAEFSGIFPRRLPELLHLAPNAVDQAAPNTPKTPNTLNEGRRTAQLEVFGDTAVGPGRLR
ncbi:hypothetical protein [Compostimonas suwonensis]|uniref:Uncharacterized protein n=1 Tax=Compostimonas suwonensis TaxID=1048394 RepID=A0A2M9C4D0_9MICO|nr:hypothetical protein [Compostimonas suwonensis]PJJ65391.1 hypothetical protein CLV54_0424 [Compostimonas suwonensis]